MSESPSWESWDDAAGAAEGLQRALVDLRLNKENTVTAIDAALSGPHRRDVLTILEVLSPDYSRSSLDTLLGVALSVRDTLTVRELLGRLPYSEAKAVVPGAVWRLLDEEDDGDAYRRMAELLDHLGLNDALKELCRRAYDSIDPDVREVASDYAGP